MLGNEDRVIVANLDTVSNTISLQNDNTKLQYLIKMK